jgi:hypothetical protein
MPRSVRQPTVTTRSAATLLVWLVAVVGGLWGVGPRTDHAAVVTEARVDSHGNSHVDAHARHEAVPRPTGGKVEAPATSLGLSGLASRGATTPDRATHTLPLLAVALARASGAAPTAATQASAHTRAATTRGGVLPYYPTAPPAGR